MTNGNGNGNGSTRISLHAIISVAVALAMAFGGYAINRVDQIAELLRVHEMMTAHVGQEQRAKDVERRLSALERR